MAPIQVHIKHAGKTHDVDLDTDLPPNAFKEAIYQKTGVPVDRMKVMIKGGVLKEDTPWKKVAPKQGQTFMVVGAAGELPKPPEKPIVFLEDMDDSELAEALAMPVGLRNLGNTCYMNASVQALRAIPELQIALSASALQSTTPLPSSLRDLYTSMSRTSDTVVPFQFLSTLRQVNPQFAEMDRREKTPSALAMGGQGYAQQDAEECWGQIVQTLGNVPGLNRSGNVPSESELAVERPKRFVEQWLMGEMKRELTCDEAPEEQTTTSFESFLKIECNIDITTNFMMTGIMKSFDQKVEKRSPTLGRDALYTQKTRITRLPGYLVVHMVRFAWRQDIMKKAKIMRKVKFPTEFDALDLATDELREKLLPVSRKLKDIERERAERRKVRKRTKTAVATTTGPALTTTDVEMGDAAGQAGVDVPSEAAPVQGRAADVSSGGGDASKGDALGDELEYRLRELEELEKLIDESVKSDVGASVHGLYELVSIVTHKGAAADAGHYIGFVKKSVFHKPSSIAATGISGPSQATSEAAASASANASLGNLAGFDETDEDWYKFDDEKVSTFPVEKLSTLDGGGEDSSAYLLVYKSKSLV